MVNKRKAILFGIDGATWNILDKYISDGYLPTFDYVIKQGVRGTLLSTVPMVTLPAWTSIFTGVNPGKHGITDFIIQHNDRFVLANSRYRETQSLWQILSEYDRTSIVVNDPTTFPPEKIKGIMTTGLVTPPGSNYVYPPELKSEIERVADGYMSDLPVEYYQVLAEDKRKGYSFVEKFAEKIFRVTLHLAHNYDWTILAPIFTSTDKLQHFYWFDEHYIRKHYEWIDSCLKSFLDLASNETADLFIVSDHGFGPLKKALYINSWLTKNGLQRSKTNHALSFMSRIGLKRSQLLLLLRKMGLYNLAYNIAKNRIKGFTEMALFFDKPIDFENSLAYSEGGGIYISKKLKEEELDRIRNMIISKLNDLKDDGSNIIDKVFKREEVLWGPHSKRAPELFLIPSEGYILRYWSDGANGDNVAEINYSKGIKAESTETGGHRPEGIFIAYGPNLVSGLQLKDLVRTWDIAPTLLHVLGLPIPSYMDGKVLLNIFKSNLSIIETSRPELQSERDRIRKRIKINRLGSNL